MGMGWFYMRKKGGMSCVSGVSEGSGARVSGPGIQEPGANCREKHLAVTWRAALNADRSCRTWPQDAARSEAKWAYRVPVGAKTASVCVWWVSRRKLPLADAPSGADPGSAGRLRHWCPRKSREKSGFVGYLNAPYTSRPHRTFPILASSGARLAGNIAHLRDFARPIAQQIAWTPTTA